MARDLERVPTMLRWSLIFFVLALVAALFGFGGIAAGAASIGKLLFFGFVVIAIVSLILSLFGGGAGRRT